MTFKVGKPRGQLQVPEGHAVEPQGSGVSGDSETVAMITSTTPPSAVHRRGLQQADLHQPGVSLSAGCSRLYRTAAEGMDHGGGQEGKDTQPARSQECLSLLQPFIYQHVL